MQLAFGTLKITLAKTYQHGNALYYQRHVPTPLRDRYPVKILKHNLKTLDPIKAAKLADALERHYNAEFAALKQSPDATPTALKAHAVAFLRQWGLEPQSPRNDPMALELLQDYIDDKRMAHAGGDEHAYRTADASDYLTPVEIEAGKRLHGLIGETISDALKVYLENNRKKDDEKFVTFNERAMKKLVSITGEKEVKAFTRSDARIYIAKSLESGNKTATVRRRVNLFRAVWNSYRLESAPDMPNVWESLVIAGEGKDSKSRQTFTPEELTTLLTECKSADDQMRWVLAMLADTGARLAEVVGLLLDDINLEGEIPYVLLQVHPWRDIKGANGIRGKKDRKVPLVGAALWAARRVKSTAAAGQQFAFPQYASEDECKSSHASTALNAWMRRIPLEHTCHELRHTMKDRLRLARCPKEVHDAVTGHGAMDTGDGYGEGVRSMVEVTHEWLEKVALKMT